MKQYELVERLGSGGMGEVYRARLPAGDGVTRAVAVKKIRAELAGEHGFARFAREARMASRLGHPNIVPVLDFGRDDAGCPLLVMELVEGVPLARVIDAGTLPPLAAVIHVVTEMLRGLGHAHRAGLVHCDVSPSNVLIGWDGSGCCAPRLPVSSTGLSTWTMRFERLRPGRRVSACIHARLNDGHGREKVHRPATAFRSGPQR